MTKAPQTLNIRQMIKKPKRLFLYLAIASFCGVVAIFISDGYIGVYDTLTVTVGEYDQEIRASHWDNENPPWVYDETVTGNIYFSYKVDNNQLDEYAASIQASVWQENEKVADLFSQDVSIARLDDATVEWTLAKEDIGYTDPTPNTRVNYTVKINRDDVEREIIVSFYNPEGIIVPKPVR